MPILLQVNDNRTALVMIQWKREKLLHKRMCWMQGWSAVPLSFEADVLLLDVHVPGAQFEGDLWELLTLGAEIRPILSQGEVGVSLKKNTKKIFFLSFHLDNL